MHKNRAAAVFPTVVDRIVTVFVKLSEQGWPPAALLGGHRTCPLSPSDEQLLESGPWAPARQEAYAAWACFRQSVHCITLSCICETMAAGGSCPLLPQGSHGGTKWSVGLFRANVLRGAAAKAPEGDVVQHHHRLPRDYSPGHSDEQGRAVWTFSQPQPGTGRECLAQGLTRGRHRSPRRLPPTPEAAVTPSVPKNRLHSPRARLQGPSAAALTQVPDKHLTLR